MFLPGAFYPGCISPLINTGLKKKRYCLGRDTGLSVASRHCLTERTAHLFIKNGGTQKLVSRRDFNGTSDGDVWLASSLRYQVLESHSPWLLAPLPLHPLHPHSHPHHIHFTSHPSTLFHSHSIHSHRIHSHHLYHKHIYTRHMPVGYHTGHPPTSLRSTSICTPPIHTPRLGIGKGDFA